MRTPHLSRRECLLLGLACATSPLRAQAPNVSWREALARLQSRGSHHFKYWGLSIYHAELQVAADFDAQRFAQQRLALSLTYARSLKGMAIADRSVSEMQALAQRVGHTWVAAQAAQWQSQLRALIPDVQAGDRITGVNQPKLGTTFFFNQAPLGTIEGPDFAALFFGLWLSPLSPEPAMRQALLAS